jgi:hypothetical protein
VRPSLKKTLYKKRAGGVAQGKTVSSDPSTEKKKKPLKLELPYDTAIPLLGMYLKECKSGYNKGTCTLMFIVYCSIIHNS